MDDPGAVSPLSTTSASTASSSSSAAGPSTSLSPARWPLAGIAVTAVATAAVMALSRVPLPGVLEEAAAVLHWGTLGLAPFLVGFVVVEVAAAARSAWRPLRGTIDGRRRLRRASFIVAAVVALFQSSPLLSWLELLGPGHYLARLGALAAGFVVTAGAIRVIDERGVGHGLSLLCLLSSLGSVVHDARILTKSVRLGEVAPAGLLLSAVGVAVVVGMVVVSGVDERHPARAPRPAAGLLPVWLVLLLVSGSATVRALAPSLVPQLPDVVAGGLQVAVAVVATVALCAIFGAVDGGVLGSVGFVVVVVALPLLLQKLGVTLNVVDLVVAAAIIKDIVVEVRARGDGAVVHVASLPRPALAGPALAALGERHIFGFVRGLHHRTLLQFLGPFVPVDIYVPADRADEARQICNLLVARTTKAA